MAAAAIFVLITISYSYPSRYVIVTKGGVYAVEHRSGLFYKYRFVSSEGTYQHSTNALAWFENYDAPWVPVK
jgi:hypothetical protein